jgi:hypothetical protein
VGELRTRSEYLEEMKKKEYQESSKRRLTKILETKFKTTFIGALSVFEKYFGHLWGKDKGQLTEREKEFQLVWKNVRNEILNNGNSQIRAVYNELDHHIIDWQRYNYTFNIKDGSVLKERQDAGQQ